MTKYVSTIKNEKNTHVYTHTQRKRERESAREIERDQFIGIEKVNRDQILSEVK